MNGYNMTTMMTHFILNNFLGFTDMKIIYLALSPQLQMHNYLP